MVCNCYCRTKLRLALKVYDDNSNNLMKILPAREYVSLLLRIVCDMRVSFVGGMDVRSGIRCAGLHIVPKVGSGVFCTTAALYAIGQHPNTAVVHARYKRGGRKDKLEYYEIVLLLSLLRVLTTDSLSNVVNLLSLFCNALCG